MQPCNRIYYSTVHWQLNMFRAAYRSSSVALTVFAASGYIRMWWPAGRAPHAYVNQRLQIQLELLMMSGMPLKTCWAVNERWNNKFCYKVASCWLFLLSRVIYQAHTFCRIFFPSKKLNFNIENTPLPSVNALKFSIILSSSVGNWKIHSSIWLKDKESAHQLMEE